MGHSQAHVAKYEIHKFAFYPKMSKYVNFLFSPKTEHLC